MTKTCKISTVADSTWRTASSKAPKTPSGLEASNAPGLKAAPLSSTCSTKHSPQKPRARFIGKVSDSSDVCRVSTEVTVDSAAEESVCPASWGDHFGTDPVTDEQQMTFVNASGGRIAHHGSRRVVVVAPSGENLAMKFQVTDVRKPLLAVSRLCEQGNIVQFGPRPGDSFVQNVSDGHKLLLERRGNSWVIPGKLATSGF